MGRDGGDLRHRLGKISAAKHYVLDGQAADAFVVSSRAFNGAPGLFLIEADAAGLTRDARTLVDNRRVAEREARGRAGAGGRSSR